MSKLLSAKIKAFLFSLLSLALVILTLLGWCSLKHAETKTNKQVAPQVSSQVHSPTAMTLIPTAFLIIGIGVSGLVAVIFYLFMLNYLRSKQSQHRQKQWQLISHCLKTFNQTDSLDSSLRRLIKALAKTLDWPIAHIYQVTDGKLISSHHWYLRRSIRRQYQGLVTLIERSPLGTEKTLPESSFKSAKLIWLTQPNKDQRLRQFNYHNQGIALRSGMALPLFDQAGQVKQIIEFFSPNLKVKDEQLTNLLDLLTHQISQALHQKEIEEAVQTSELQKDLILNTVNEGIFSIDLNGYATHINPAALSKLGYEKNEIINKNIFSLIHTSTPFPVGNCLQRGQAYYNQETSLRCKDNSIIPVQYTCTPTYQNNTINGATIIFSDLSTLKTQNETIKTNALLMDRLIKIQEDYIAGKEPQALYEDILSILIELSQSQFGFIANFQNQTKPCLTILATNDPSLTNASDQSEVSNTLRVVSVEKLPQIINSTLRKASITIDNSPQQDSHFPTKTKNYLGIPIYGKNGLIGIACLTNSTTGYDNRLVKSLLPIIHSLSSIIEANSASTLLKKMAHHDSLTGLYNVSHFEKQLSQGLLQARKNNEFFALLIIDIDGLNSINNNYGRQVGDKLLKAIAERIQSAASNEDIIARTSGDEFTMLCTQTNSAHSTGRHANHLIKLLTRPYKINTYHFSISVSIGISCFPHAGQSAKKLFESLNIALYRAKNSKGRRYQFYRKELQAEHERKLTIESEVFFAGKKEQFFLAYQPQFNLKTKSLIGFEALIRWQHPLLGIIAPDEFIPLVENSKKVHDFGFWVIERALQDLKELEKRMYNNPFKVAINVSSRQIQPRFIGKLKQLLEKHEVHPSRIELELTETSIMNHMEIAPILEELRKLGISIAIDDFGTGYSSLTRLKDIPADILKIDRSFIMNAIESKESKYIIENTIDLAHKLNLKTIAEGVETEEQLDLLSKLNCHFGQGYHFAKPLNLPNLLLWLKSRENKSH